MYALRVAPTIALTEAQHAVLTQQARGRSVPVRVCQRAKMVLLAAEGRQNKEIAQSLSTAPATVARWRFRFLQQGVPGIETDAPRSGRKPSLPPETVQEIVRRTTQERPPQATQWSTRSMAKASGVSEATVRRIWRKHGLRPHRVKTFKLSNDPRLQTPWHHHPVRRAQHPRRHGDRYLYETAPTRGVAEILVPDRTGDSSRKGTASHRRQLRNAQTSRRPSVARTAPTVPYPLHAYQRLVGEHGRTLLPRHHRPAHSSWSLPQCRRTRTSYRGLPGPPQSATQAFH